MRIPQDEKFEKVVVKQKLIKGREWRGNTSNC